MDNVINFPNNEFKNNDIQLNKPSITFNGDGIIQVKMQLINVSSPIDFYKNNKFLIISACTQLFNEYKVSAGRYIAFNVFTDSNNYLIMEFEQDKG